MTPPSAEVRARYEATRGTNGFSASIDRIDAKKGYTKDNCRLILQAENMFKGTLCDADVLMIAGAICRKGEAW